MLRNSKLLEKNSKYLAGVVEVIASAAPSLWEIDANCYDEGNIESLVKLSNEICDALPDVSGTDTLKTKIMLGVFGSVPGFDITVSQGCIAEGIGGTFKRSSLKELAGFYQRNAAVIDSDKYRVPTLDFVSGVHTQRRYPCAKVLDMALSIEGADRLKTQGSREEGARAPGEG